MQRVVRIILMLTALAMTTTPVCASMGRGYNLPDLVDKSSLIVKGTLNVQEDGPHISVQKIDCELIMRRGTVVLTQSAFPVYILK